MMAFNWVRICFKIGQRRICLEMIHALTFCLVSEIRLVISILETSIRGAFWDDIHFALKTRVPTGRNDKKIFNIWILVVRIEGVNKLNKKGRFKVYEKIRKSKKTF